MNGYTESMSRKNSPSKGMDTVKFSFISNKEFSIGKIKNNGCKEVNY